MTHVLVIDDDQSVCNAIECLLHDQGCTIVLAPNGHLGGKSFKTSAFDIVMVDIFMPEMDGLDTIKNLREHAPTVPIIAMSGFRFRNSLSPSPDFLGMAAELGAAYCLRKPFGRQQLMTAIQACLDWRHPSATTAERQSSRHGGLTDAIVRSAQMVSPAPEPPSAPPRS